MSFKIDEAAIRKLAKLLDETNLTEIEISGDPSNGGGGSLRVQRAAPQMVAAAHAPVSHAAPVAAAPVAAPAVKAEDHPGVVKSPMVGTVYMAGAPGNPPFVEIGKQVTKGDTLLIIEAMKVMNPIKAPATGKITQILVSDAKPVEFGEALVVIE